MITVLADRHLYQLKRFLHPCLRLDTYDSIAGWTAEQVLRADALLVRTTHPVNATTLPRNSKVRFAATASAGRDHLDKAWLDCLNVTVADAGGSNARSVAEYVAVTVLTACDALDLAPSELTAGVIGAGFTGSEVADLLGKLGITCVLYDPPREERDRAAGHQTPFVSASEQDALECDILTLHVPLERGGPHATWHWLDQARLTAAPKKLVVNASRGHVVDERALLTSHADGHVRLFACDVWEGEPVFSDTTARKAFLSTPHIAGYSIQAKRNASEMICSALHRFFALEHPVPEANVPHPQEIPDKDVSLRDLIGHLHPVFSYDAGLRKRIGKPDALKRTEFLQLRQNTPLRNEFGEIGLDAAVLRRHPLLSALGFRSAQTDTA